MVYGDKVKKKIEDIQEYEEKTLTLHPCLYLTYYYQRFLPCL